MVSIEVVGAKSDDDAHNAARRVSISPLVKTAFYGSDANWGRILCAAGNSEAEESLPRRPVCSFPPMAVPSCNWWPRAPH